MSFYQYDEPQRGSEMKLTLGKLGDIEYQYDDPATFNNGCLNFTINILESEVIPVTRVDSDSSMGLPGRVTFQVPNHAIDCNDLVIPNTAWGDFYPQIILGRNIYGLAIRGGHGTRFTYDVGHGNLGNPSKNKYLCTPPGFFQDVVYVRTWEQNPPARLSDAGKELVRTLVQAKIDGKQLYQELQSLGFDLSGNPKYMRTFASGWHLNGQPIIIQSLLESLSANQQVRTSLNADD